VAYLKSILVAILFGVAVQATTLTQPRNSFLGGEISPLMVQRLETPQFEAGCRTLENMLVVGPGAVTRRPGSVYVATTAGDGPARLEPFVYSEADAYILEFTNQKLRFYRDTGQVLSGVSPYEVNTPFTTGELFGLQMYQSADVMYIVDANHLPQKLSRLGHTSWTIADVNITTGPFREQNITTTSVTPSAVTGPITLDASTNIFDANHVGALWKISHVMPTQTVSGTFSGTGQSASAVAGTTAPYSFQFTATSFQGTIKLQVSYDNGTSWVDNYTAVNAAAVTMDANSTELSDFGQNVLLRVACTNLASGSVNYELDIDSYVHSGIVRLTARVDANEVDANVLDRLGIALESTTLWAEGAWSVYRGYPNAVTGHFGRIVYAKDLTAWWSHVENFEDFSINFGADDESFTWIMSQARQNPIRWLIGERSQNIIAGTLGKIMDLRPLDELSGFTAANPPKVASSSAIACGLVYPAVAESVVLLADRTGRHIHELVYDNAEQTVTGPDLTQLAQHVTGTGIVQMAFQKTPYPVLWCARSDGEMATLYYNRSYGVAAWSRQVTDGEYASVATVPTENGFDRVWAVVDRGGHYYVEYFSDLDMDAVADDAYYLDSGLRWDGGAAVDVNHITTANPGVVTLATWPVSLVHGIEVPLADGAQVRIESVTGMTEINERVFTAASCNVGAKTLALKDAAGTTNWTTAGYTTYTSGGTLEIVDNTFAGLTHLNGETVSVLGDGSYYGTAVVTAGEITLTDYYNHVAVGLPYTSTVTPIEIDFATAVQSTAPYMKRIVGLYVNVYNSIGGKYGPDATQLREIPWPRTASATTFATGPEPKTGAIVLPPFAGFRREATFTLVQDVPLPFTLRAVTPLYEVNQ